MTKSIVNNAVRGMLQRLADVEELMTNLDIKVVRIIVRTDRYGTVNEVTVKSYDL